MPALLTQQRSRLVLLCVAPPVALAILAGAAIHAFHKMGVVPPPSVNARTLSVSRFPLEINPDPVILTADQAGDRS